MCKWSIVGRARVTHESYERYRKEDANETLLALHPCALLIANGVHSIDTRACKLPPFAIPASDRNRDLHTDHTFSPLSSPRTETDGDEALDDDLDFM